jgi:hypothetical protein
MYYAELIGFVRRALTASVRDCAYRKRPIPYNINRLLLPHETINYLLLPLPEDEKHTWTAPGGRFLTLISQNDTRCTEYKTAL